MNMRDMKIGARLGIGFGILMALLAVLTVYRHQRMRSISTRLGQYRERRQREGKAGKHGEQAPSMTCCSIGRSHHLRNERGNQCKRRKTRFQRHERRLQGIYKALAKLDNIGQGPGADGQGEGISKSARDNKRPAYAAPRKEQKERSDGLYFKEARPPR